MYVPLGLLVVVSALVAPAVVRHQRLQREPLAERRELRVVRVGVGALSLCLLIAAGSVLIQVLR